MTQATYESPFPWKIHRNKRGWPRWWQRWYEAWLVLTGRYTFWHAWHEGKHRGSMDEYRRVIINGGDTVPMIDAAIYATSSRILNCEPTSEKMGEFRRAARERYERDYLALAGLSQFPHNRQPTETTNDKG